MSQWEYSHIFLGTYSNYVEFLRPDGNHKTTDVYSDKNKKAKPWRTILAELGLEGWEMVGCSTTMGGMDLFFKRSLPRES